MANVTLTQSSRGSFPTNATTLNFAVNMSGQSVDFDAPAGTCKFNGYGPSTGTLSNVTTSGNDGRGNPTKVGFAVAGTGNITGNGNDDVYSGSGSFNLHWTQQEGGGHDTVQASGGSISLTYTD